jgi:hypothetical protein
MGLSLAPDWIFHYGIPAAHLSSKGHPPGAMDASQDWHPAVVSRVDDQTQSLTEPVEGESRLVGCHFETPQGLRFLDLSLRDTLPTNSQRATAQGRASALSAGSRRVRSKSEAGSQKGSRSPHSPSTGPATLQTSEPEERPSKRCTLWVMCAPLDVRTWAAKRVASSQ